MSRKREYTCDYGDCPKTMTTPRVTVTTRWGDAQVDEQKRFCCFIHAALWLIRRVRQLELAGEPMHELKEIGK